MGRIGVIGGALLSQRGVHPPRLIRLLQGRRKSLWGCRKGYKGGGHPRYPKVGFNSKFDSQATQLRPSLKPRAHMQSEKINAMLFGVDKGNTLSAT